MMLSMDAEVRVEELRVRIGCHAFQINVAALKVTTKRFNILMDYDKTRV